MASRDPQRIRAETVAAAANRVPLSKRAWRDVRKASDLNNRGGVRFVEIHGVKITFNWEQVRLPPLAEKHTGSGDSHGPKRASQPRQPRIARGATGEASTAAPSGNPAAPRGNARQRRSRTRLQEFLQRKRDAAAAQPSADQVAAAVDTTDATMESA